MKMAENNLENLALNNPGVDIVKLKQMQESAKKLRMTRKGRYRFNLVAPFSGRTKRFASDAAADDATKETRKA